MPVTINIGRKILPMVYLMKHTDLSIMYNPDLKDRLMIASWKDAMRCLEKVGIFQAYMVLAHETVCKPVVTFSHFTYSYEYSVLPYQSPKIIGLRRITPKDIPKALALTN